MGVCSYLLIGHWFQKPSARDAAQKAFIVTRVGDAALFVGIIIFWAQTGTTSFDGISQAAQAGFIGGSLFTAAVVLVFVGAIGKSAQFPLHVWLPDAMEGPTPVSALIHAATMVAAGVYLVARTYDIFIQSETAMLTVAYIGGFTAIMAATMALVKKDIKRVVAYSTVSQLGYMMLALGIGSYTAGMFHLYNHAFFKALLFLGAGSIIYAMNSYSLADMGGLRRRMPVTFWTMVIAGLSLAGIFPLSGFWSKDAIVAGAFEEHYYVLFGMALITVFLTAFYIFRAIFMAFTGEPRSDEARAAADPPGIMTLPMILLAVLSVVSGWIGIPEGFAGLPLRDYFAEFVAPSGFATETLSATFGIEPHGFSFGLALLSVLVGAAGIGLAYFLYVMQPERAASLARSLSGLHTFLDKGWYIDALYGATFVRAARALGRATNVFDRRGLDRGVGGVGRGAQGFGEFSTPVPDGRGPELRAVYPGERPDHRVDRRRRRGCPVRDPGGRPYRDRHARDLRVRGSTVITTITIFIPLLGALLILLLPDDDERLIRYAALAVAAIPLALVLFLILPVRPPGATSTTPRSRRTLPG